jgi:hypothetical protein
MEVADARAIVDAYFETFRAGCEVELEINHAITEEHPLGFVFFYNTPDFWTTRDLSKSVAGNGPILIRRESGEVVMLPSFQSVARSLLELESNDATQASSAGPQRSKT